MAISRGAARARRVGVGALALAVALALAGLAGRWAGDAATDKLRLAGSQRLDAYAVSLENLLSKYDFLPGTLQLNRDVIALLEHPRNEELRDDVNAYLEQLNRQSGSTTIYIVNLDGVTQAASNWRSIRPRATGPKASGRR